MMITAHVAVSPCSITAHMTVCVHEVSLPIWQSAHKASLALWATAAPLQRLELFFQQVILLAKAATLGGVDA